VGGVEHLEGGTIWPPGSASILMRPPVTISSRLPKACIWSKACAEAGQLVWIFSVFCACGWADAGCDWACAGNDIVADTANAASPNRNLFIILPPSIECFPPFFTQAPSSVFGGTTLMLDATGPADETRR